MAGQPISANFNPFVEDYFPNIVISHALAVQLVLIFTYLLPSTTEFQHNVRGIPFSVALNRSSINGYCVCVARALVKLAFMRKS